MHAPWLQVPLTLDLQEFVLSAGVHAPPSLMGVDVQVTPLQLLDAQASLGQPPPGLARLQTPNTQPPLAQPSLQKGWLLKSPRFCQAVRLIAVLQA
jgi:hypothetical protein